MALQVARRALMIIMVAAAAGWVVLPTILAALHTAEVASSHIQKLFRAYGLELVGLEITVAVRTCLAILEEAQLQPDSVDKAAAS